MEAKKRFSKDPKTSVISIEEFFNSFLLGGPKFKQMWIGETAPEMESVYYKFTPQYLLRIVYGHSITNFGWGCKEKLEKIEVAYRDGKTEYELFDKTINTLKENADSSKSSKAKTPPITYLELWKGVLPDYQENAVPKTKPFSFWLKNTGYTTGVEEYKNKYLVFDVETNGTRTSVDDLLSLSIYDPTTGICYNRFFPLDMQPLILTEHIHGINDKMLAESTHWTQEELDWLIDFFHINDRILLSYSGGDGTFDCSFVQNYCKRHRLTGFENISLENIKNLVPHAPYGTEGQLNKDNLCRLFGIKGVRKKHSSYTDCLLEWKLFEKLKSDRFLFLNEHLFKYSPNYIVPFSYLTTNPQLAEYANVPVPYVVGKATEVYSLEFPNELLKTISKFTTNITGVSIEHGINALLNAEKQNNARFLSENKSHLEYIGSLYSRIRKVLITAEADGTLKAVSKKDEAFIKRVNQVTKTIVEHIAPIADYLKSHIFTEGRIMTQELVISDDRKVLALCDLSDSKNVVEIKTKRIFAADDGTIKGDLAQQLYYQSKGRNAYVLSVLFETRYNSKSPLEPIVDDLTIHLYRVELSAHDAAKVVREKTLSHLELLVLKEITNNPIVSKAEIVRRTSDTVNGVNYAIGSLERFGYIKKEKPTSKKSSWIVLRSPEDTITKYTTDGKTIHFV